MASGYQLGPFEVGQIKAHIHHGLSAAAIARIVCKADGTHVSDKGVLSVMARLEADPDWRGERKVGSGRKRKTSRALDKRVAKEVVNPLEKKVRILGCPLRPYQNRYSQEVFGAGAAHV